MGASGIAMWGSDTGGFMSTLDRLTPELLRRWIQFSAFCPVMRTKAGGIEVPEYDRPQIWDADVLPSWRRWAGWHARLNDYLMAAHETYRATGRPIMCAVELVYPDVGPVPDQYLLGEHLLVAPVVEPGCTVRRVVLPEGQWADLFAPARWLQGPAAVEVAVGPDDIPVFVRAGAVLALLPEDVGSLSPYAPALPDRRTVLAFPGRPGRSWEGALGPGLSCRSQAGDDSWTLELSAPGSYSWDVSAPLPAAPVGVDLEGSWSFTGGTFACAARGASVLVQVSWAQLASTAGRGPICRASGRRRGLYPGRGRGSSKVGLSSDALPRAGSKPMATYRMVYGDDENVVRETFEDIDEVDREDGWVVLFRGDEAVLRVREQHVQEMELIS
jgi:hypothetical protein